LENKSLVTRNSFHTLTTTVARGVFGKNKWSYLIIVIAPTQLPLTMLCPENLNH